MNEKNYTLVPDSALNFLSLLLICFLYSSSLTANNSYLTLICPDDLFVQLDPGECGTTVNFDTLQWTASQPLTDSLFFPPSGTYFEIGTNTVTLAVTYENGTLETCTFNVVIQEFLPETLVCQNQVFVSLEGQCTRELLPEEILEPDSTGCVDNFEVIRLSSAGQALNPEIDAFDINETFLAVVKHNGNGMQCFSQVTVTGGTPPAITCPPSANIFCNVPLDTAATGYPEFSGCYQDLDITYYDETTSANCVDTFAFQTIRHWVSTDPYGKKDTCDQIITAVRYDINQVTFPENYDGIEKPVIPCDASQTLEELTGPDVTGYPLFLGNLTDITEDCEVSSGFQDFTNTLCGGNVDIIRVWSVVKLCPPTFTIRDTQIIKVVDTLAPQFSLSDTIFISDFSACEDTFLLEGAGAISECGSVFTEIITPWDTLYTNGGMTHTDLVPGIYEAWYTLTDDCGYSNTDTSFIVIENETLVSCPPNDTIDCDTYIDVIAPAILNKNFQLLATLGMPDFHDNCTFDVTETDSVAVNSCGEGILFRNLAFESSSQQSCVQEIHVFHQSDFSIIFPRDTSICIHPDSVDLGNPIQVNTSCENITVDLEETIIPKGLNGCFTLRKKWIVTNTCAYAGVNTSDDISIGDNHYEDGGDGIIVYEQVIEVSNEVTPLFVNGCEIPDLNIPSNSCEVTVTVPVPEIQACDTFNLTVSGGLGTNLNANVKLGPGTYQATYRATDLCGKQGSCITSFEVKDVTAPVIVCDTNTIQIVLEPPANPGDLPLAVLFLSDIQKAGTDNCGNLQFSFLSDTIVSSLTYDCSWAGLTFPEQVWGIDDHGNAGACQVNISVLDPQELCETDVTISGEVKTENGTGIGNVSIVVTSSEGTTDTIAADLTGGWSAIVPSGADYTITPYKDINPINGVTTFDGVVTTRHILGIDTLDSPYKIIASDNNRSGSVTTFDIVELRRLILNINTSFPNNTSWQFVPSGVTFPNPLNPWQDPYPESIILLNLSDDTPGLDFTGMKTGDANNSANPEN